MTQNAQNRPNFGPNFWASTFGGVDRALIPATFSTPKLSQGGVGTLRVKSWQYVKIQKKVATKNGEMSPEKISRGQFSLAAATFFDTCDQIFS
jgi:hypothetical protein